MEKIGKVVGGSSKPKEVKPPPTRDDAADAKQQELAKARQQAAAQSTIKTGADGVRMDQENYGRRTLGGS